jgi:CubicO group peptidase (beta-lactamase class C family)
MIETFTISWWVDLTRQAGLEGSRAWHSPGTRHEYNNLGHTLIALIAEEITGSSYRDALQIYLFARFGITGISEETGRVDGYAPGWGDGLVCFLTSNGEPYFDDRGQVAITRCSPDFVPPADVPGVDGCACNDNQGWTRLEGYYGSFGLGAGGVAATAAGLATFLRKLHASHPGLEGAWGAGILPAEEYAQLYDWACDNDNPELPRCEGFFHQYSRGFYSRYKVLGDPSSGLVYGHEGGGHLPCKDMIDWSTGSILVMQANRKTAQLDESLMWRAYVDGLAAIGSSPSSLGE